MPGTINSNSQVAKSLKMEPFNMLDSTIHTGYEASPLVDLLDIDPAIFNVGTWKITMLTYVRYINQHE